MLRNVLLFSATALALAACAPPPPTLGPDGKPLPRAYDLRRADVGEIDYRVLDSVNTLRGAKGLAPLQLNAELNAAAATHARDVSVQNRAWHFGSDGSSPVVRAQRAGYTGRVLGEDISETYETELETLAAWMDQPGTREVLLNPEARDLGFAWHQDPSSKIWWVLMTGTPN